jgi:2'-5' RNA ligase
MAATNEYCFIKAEDSNTKKRCIMIFPQFSNINIIDRIREKYDPLANNVRPHITIVFPFQSNISKEELQEYLVASLNGMKSFHLTLEGVIRVYDDSGYYLFLGVKEGVEKIKELHDKLYEGMLKEYKPNWLNNVEFMPHMTIGNFYNKEELDSAYRDVGGIKGRFSTIVDKISVEIVDKNEDSIIEMEVILS